MAKKKKKETSNLACDLLNLSKLDCLLVDSLESLDGSYVLQTGVFALDLILSHKHGLLPGKIIEVFGTEGTGKTSLCLQTFKNAIKQDLECHYVDIERGLNSSVVKCFGLTPKSKKNPDGDFYLYRPSHGDAALNTIKQILETRQKCVVVLDSIAGCIPKDIYDEEIGKGSFKSVANIMSPFIGQARSLCENSESILIMLNQVRDNLSRYGKATKEPGGRAVKFHTDYRVELKRTEFIKNAEQKIGHVIKATTVKNRLSIPNADATFHLVYGKGFSVGLDLLHLGLQFGVVQKNGAWFIMPDESKQHGQINAAQAIEEDESVQELIRAQVLELMT